MSALMFYQKPELLSREAHKNKKISSEANFAFAREAQSMFVAGAEFVQACQYFPIVFTPRAQGGMTPAAVLGLREKQNLFVDAAGGWEGSYIPAFVRRYPFVLTELGSGAENKTMGVCIDEACAALNDEEGQALFDAQGNNTPFLQKALEFLNNYQDEHARTLDFCKRLSDMGLFKETEATAKMASGEEFSLKGMWVVDEAKLLQLSDAQALQLYRRGELGWVYAHLVSLTRFNHLVDRLAKLQVAA